MEIRPRRAETHPILAGVMMDEAILLPSSGAARAARLLKRHPHLSRLVSRCIEQMFQIVPVRPEGHYMWA